MKRKRKKKGKGHNEVKLAAGALASFTKQSPRFRLSTLQVVLGVIIKHDRGRKKMEMARTQKAT